MKIERLVLKNFRGIREMDLEFDERLTVLAGLNGAGKSSILHALALPLSDVFKQPPSWEKGKPCGVKNSDISNGKASGRIRVLLRSDRKSDEPDFDLAVEHDASHGFDEAASPELKKSASVNRMEDSLHRDRESSGSLLAIRYVPERHMGPGHANRVRGDVLAPRFAYRSALYCGSGWRQFFSWFRNRQNADLMSLEKPWNEALQMLRRGERPPGTDPHLFAVRKAIADFMDGRALYVEEKTFYIYKYKEERQLGVNQLSDGEKGLLGLVGDLTHRLSITHPHLIDSDELLEKAEAVVMIDEVEQHLHPAWQRMVVPRLLETFPNVQFIITTHSPQVLGEIKSKNIVVLEDTPQGIQHRRFSREVHGMTSSHILEALMGTPERTETVQDAVRDAYSAIERNELQEAKHLLAKLTEEAEDIPDLERIAMRIRRKEAIGK